MAMSGPAVSHEPRSYGLGFAVTSGIGNIKYQYDIELVFSRTGVQT